MAASAGWTKALLAVICCVAIVAAQDTYTVGVIEQAPLVIRGRNDSSTPTGFIPDLLEEIATKLDIQFTYLWVDTYGGKNADGSWTGLVQKVMDGEVDIGGAALTITAEREEVIDFSKPYMSSGISAVMAKPDRKRSGPDYFLFLRPFRAAVWVLFVVCFIVFGLCLFLLNKYHPFEHRAAFAEGNSTEKEARGLDLGGSYWLTCTLTLLQGFDRSPRSRAGRVLFVVWGLFVLITIVLYAATLVQIYQHGSGPQPQKTYRTVKDIVDAGVDLGYIEDGSTAAFFENSAIELYQTVADKAEGLANIDEGLEMVRQGDFALFTESAFLEHQVQKRPCDLMMIEETLNSVGYGFGFQDGNALKDTFSATILTLQEDGVLSDLEQTYWQNECEAETTEVDDVMVASPPRSLSAAEYTGAIVFFLVGLIIAALVAVAEVMIPKLKDRAPKNTNEKLITAEEGQALNQTTMSALNETAAEPTPETAEEEPKKADDVGEELEPEDKEEREEKREERKEEEDPDRIEHISSPVEVKS